MLSFATLFLGLTLGTHAVEVVAPPGVASIELRVDGRLCARLEREPWRGNCDFGDELLPRELTATAFDGDGGELAVGRQWINTPRQPAEVSAVLEAEPGTPLRRVARLRWESLAGSTPPAVRAWLDGVELKVENPAEIQLPEVDPERLHLFRAELEFPGNVVSSVEVPWGGSFSDQTDSKLTAIVVQARLGRLKPEALAGRLLSDRRPLEVVAIEKAPAEIVIVRDRSADTAFAQMDLERAISASPMGIAGARSQSGRLLAARDQDWRLQFFWPVAVRRAGKSGPFDLFRHSPAFHPTDGTVFDFLTRVEFPRDLEGPQRLTDALAVAGVSVASLKSRRAAVLLVGPNPTDSGDFPPRLARRYLESIQVPMVVWATRRTAGEAWGKARRLRSRRDVELAWLDLLESLERQRIVWVRGAHLPQQIELMPTRGVELVR